MAINLNDFINKTFSKKEREEIARRSADLIAHEATLQEIRKARRRSQAKVAKKLHVKQAAVSKIERRTDMYVSTLRSFVEAMGGRLEIIAQFPGSPPVRISQFNEL